MRTFDLSFRPRPRAVCRVRVGDGARSRLVADVARRWPGGLVAVVADSNVMRSYGEPLAEGLRARGLRAAALEFPAGERSKTRATASRLEDRLAQLGAGRDAIVVGVGGGVTSDLAGFVASLWQRGVVVIHAPTSLLGMVDAAIGGKTGVNLPGAKNQVGTVHQPWGVYADVATLATLPEREYRGGFAEVIKAATIADADLFRTLERSAAKLVGRDGRALERVVVRAIEIKGRVVTRDERETGRRAILNFGHTIGHALEAASGFRLAHGEAVAVGMCVEARLAARVTGFPASHVRRLEALVAAFGLPTCPPRGSAASGILAATRRDKKARGGRARYALPRRIGRMARGREPVVAVADDLVRAVLDETCASGSR